MERNRGGGKTSLPQKKKGNLSQIVERREREKRRGGWGGGRGFSGPHQNFLLLKKPFFRSREKKKGRGV